MYLVKFSLFYGCLLLFIVFSNEPTPASCVMLYFFFVFHNIDNSIL